MVKIILVLFLAAGWPVPASASPAFSRQTGASCRLCHFQGFHSFLKNAPSKTRRHRYLCNMHIILTIYIEIRMLSL